ncbi:MAG: hypothetical protein Q9186_003391 [Xanthomendoza sp. 1 TL-2023]
MVKAVTCHICMHFPYYPSIDIGNKLTPDLPGQGDHLAYLRLGVVNSYIQEPPLFGLQPQGNRLADSPRALSFDDLPHFSADAKNTDIPPIFNPYHKLFFNGGFGYVPPPDDPFAPISPPQLAVYNYHNDSSTSQSIDAGLELHGELGAGPRVHESAYWIDAYSVWIGCANGGPTDCQIDLIGYDAFNAAIASMTVSQPPCPGLVNCKLAQITFPGDFRDLAGLQVLAYVNKTPVTFYMDDLSLGWSNNTCAAQFERSSAQ